MSRHGTANRRGQADSQTGQGARPHRYTQLLWWRASVLIVEYTFFYAIPVLAYVKTLSISTSALTAIVEFLPRVLVLPFILRFIDRIALVSQITVSDGIRLALVGGLLVSQSLAALLMLLGVIGVLSMWSVIKFEKLVAAIDDPGRQTEVISRSQAVDQFARVVGGLIAMLAVHHLNLVAMACMVVLVSGYAALRLFHRRAFDSVAVDGWGGRRPDEHDASVSVLALLRPLALLIALLLAINLIDGVLRTLLPNLIITKFGAGAEVVPVIMTISYVFGIVMSFLFERFVLRQSGTVVLFSSLGILVAALLAMSVAPSVVAFFLGAVVFFGGRVWFNIAARIARNRLIDRQYFGRSLSLYLPAIFLPFVVAGVLVGLLARHYSASQILAGLAVCSLAGLVLLVLRRRPLLRRLGL